MASSSAGDDPVSDRDLQEERNHFHKVVNAFLYYHDYVTKRVTKLARNYDQLPVSHRQMLQEFPEHIEKLKHGVDVNQKFVQKIVASSVGMFENSPVSQFDSDAMSQLVTPALPFDMEKVKTTIKQFYRDWSKEGAVEREMCYKPIINEITTLFPPDKIEACDVSILVPGAGLGRLAYELAKRGYFCQGNEFSMYMLLGSNFILNQTSGCNSYSICPWIHQFSNVLSYDHQLTTITIPDVNPCALPVLGLFSMAAGDFLEVYTQPDTWDCVACCYFIDTANNVIQYMEKIYHILKPGGYWINFGPLLYHYSEMPGQFSIELSWEDIRRIAEKEIGFEIQKEDRHCPSHYIQNPHSMLQLSYNCVFMVARKPPTQKKSNSALQLEHSSNSSLAATNPSSSQDGDNFEEDSNPGVTTGKPTMFSTCNSTDVVMSSDFSGVEDSRSETERSIDNNITTDDVFS